VKTEAAAGVVELVAAHATKLENADIVLPFPGCSSWQQRKDERRREVERRAKILQPRRVWLSADSALAAGSAFSAYVDPGIVPRHQVIIHLLFLCER
jgi:hypothetical protein